MPEAARVGDATTHPGTIGGPGVTTVLIGGQPAAVAGDKHVCAMPPLAGPHPPTPITGGSRSVLIGGAAAARIGDSAGCGATIVSGLPSVVIGG
jgi:uncharacterized Zn-binding protein involved in type VI secretion